MLTKSAFSAQPRGWRLRDQPLIVQFLVAAGIVVLFSLVSLSVLIIQVKYQAETSHSPFISHRRMVAFVATIDFLFLLLLGAVLSKLYLSIARPISHLSRQLHRYQEGDLSARVPVENRSQIGFLAASFNEMAEKIEAMVGDLKKVDQMKTEFISTVSHELRTPLTSIGGYAKLLISEDAGPITETQREFLHIIDTNVARLTTLINDILDVEKMDSGKVQLLKQPEDLLSILKECRDTFDILAKQKGLELRLQIPSDSIMIMADRGRTVQVFMNLLSNAIKYTQSGFVELRVDLSPYAVMIKVRDSGVGLSSEDQNKIFQKFYRARGGLSSSEGGTGLGLVIVRGIIEAHGGAISVESAAGGGTTFTVSLPTMKALGPQMQPEGQGVIPLWKRVIWIIDSNEEEANQMAQIIQSAPELARGFRISVRTFKRIADTPAVSSHADVPLALILDPSGEEAGLLVIPELRKRWRETVPVLIVGSAIDPAAAFAEGAASILHKPLNRNEFADAVRDLVVSKHKRVLIADKNTDLRLLLKRAIEKRGYKVDDVDHGNQILGFLDYEHYDLVLLDMDLPDISGKDFLRIIRTISRFNQVPIFLMFEEEGVMPAPAELKDWGADLFIAKYKGIRSIVDLVVERLEDEVLFERENTAG